MRKALNRCPRDPGVIYTVSVIYGCESVPGFIAKMQPCSRRIQAPELLPGIKVAHALARPPRVPCSEIVRITITMDTPETDGVVSRRRPAVSTITPYKTGTFSSDNPFMI